MKTTRVLLLIGGIISLVCGDLILLFSLLYIVIEIATGNHIEVFAPLIIIAILCIPAGIIALTTRNNISKTRLIICLIFSIMTIDFILAAASIIGFFELKELDYDDEDYDSWKTKQ